MICPNCQRENPDTANFCYRCGAYLLTGPLPARAAARRRGPARTLLLAAAAALAALCLLAALVGAYAWGMRAGSPTAAAPAPSVLATEAADVAPRGRTPAQVVRIVDGDTIHVLIAGQDYALRYIGIDSPETGQPLADEATLANARLVEGQTVYLETDISDKDGFGRLLRYVYLADGTMVNAELVRQGWAIAKEYAPDTKYQQMLSDLQAQAQAAGAGQWQPAQKAAPIILPTSAADSWPCPGSLDGAAVVGNTNSGKFHTPAHAISSGVKPEHRLCFSSREAAILAGYVPCKVCEH